MDPVMFHRVRLKVRMLRLPAGIRGYLTSNSQVYHRVAVFYSEGQLRRNTYRLDDNTC